MRYITEQEVEENLSMKDVLDSLKEAFNYLYQGKARYSIRNRLSAGEGILNTMPASVDPWNMTGLKAYYASKKGGNFKVLVFDTEANELKFVIEANRLGQMRTGAVPALVSSILVKEKDPVFTLIGSGYQAETQLAGIMELFNPAEIRVYSRTFEHAESFADRNSRKMGVKIKAFKTAHEALEGATLVSTITDSIKPIFYASDMGSRYHVNLAGGNLPFRSEADQSILVSSDIVIAESLEQALQESKEIIEFNEQNPDRRVVELKDIFNGQDYRGKYGKSVFKSMGIGLEDLAAAKALIGAIKDE
jgi:alanine dehydrogenase